MFACPNCGTENPEIARFCMACGTALPGAAAGTAPGREARKTVTVVFADIVGSTGIGEHQDPETVRAIMGRWFDAMRAVLEHHGGTVEKFIGDAVVAVFGVPVLHEDDALRATRAAVEMRRALAALNDALAAERALRLEMRVGVNTGTVVVGDARAGGSRATGDAVNVAARLQSAAEPGETLLGDSTWRLVRDGIQAGEPREITVKGREEPVTVRALLGVDEDAEAIQRRADGPMVGRARELETLRAAFERALTGERTVMVTVLGAAGVGKSRLVHEFVQGVGDRAMVLTGRCLPYGQGITWNPLLELLRSAFGLVEDAPGTAVADALRQRMPDAPDTEAILDRLSEPLGLPTAPGTTRTAWPVEEIAWAIRRFVEWMAADHPHVIVMDDLQWAEPSLLDLLEQIAEWVHGVPVLLVSMARPELLETRPGWGGGKPDSTTFVLEPLPAAETETLIEALFGGGRIDTAARTRIATAAEGNPLFVEQLVEMLIEDRAVQRADDGTLVITELDTIQVPPTIQALLAARLDRLSDAERRTIERASVVGKEFGWREVSELTPAEGRATVSTQLLALVRKELIRPDRRREDGAETYRFRHLLIRDAAYDSLPKGERAELHERFADWLEGTAGDRLVELDEIVGYHLEQARAYRLELGPDDARTRALALRAGRRLATAGVRAADRDDTGSSTRLLSRAEVLLADDPQARYDVLLRLIEDVFQRDYPTALRFARQAEIVGASLGPLAVRRAGLYVASSLAMTEPSFVISELRAETEATIAAFEAAGDVGGVLDCIHVIVTIDLNLAHWSAAVQWAKRGLDLAAGAGLDRERGEFAASIGNSIVWGATPVAEGVSTAEDLLATTSRRSTRSLLLSTLAVLRAMDDDRPAYEAAIAESAAIRTELGLPPMLFRTAYAAYALDDLPGAVRLADEASADLERRGETGARSTMFGLKSWALVLLGRDEEAAAAAAEARRLGAEDDAVTQIQWRSATSIVAARRAAAAARAGGDAADSARAEANADAESDAAGADAAEAEAEADSAEADRLSREAVAIAAGTDSIDTVTAQIARSMVLTLIGRGTEASAPARAALAFANAKGLVNVARRAAALIDPGG
jgi:class 3 adenylate cyclase/DNA-binding transcriptional ArsR family regulator